MVMTEAPTTVCLRRRTILSVLNSRFAFHIQWNIPATQIRPSGSEP